LVSRYDQGGFSVNDLARDMIGYIVSKAAAEKRNIPRRPIISLEHFSVNMPGEEIRDLALSVYQGEILGLTSLSGHGKLALGYGMMGMYPVSGSVTYENETLARINARANIIKGMYVLPDDRHNLGILADQSLQENIIFTANQIKGKFSLNSFFRSLGLLDRRQAKLHVEKMIRDFDIKCTSADQKVKELSGTVEPRLLFVAEPTRGVDIAAKEKILNMLIEINRSQGTTIIIASSELDELKRVCDRIAVMVEGKVFKILSPNASEVEFGLALSGEEEVRYA